MPLRRKLTRQKKRPANGIAASSGGSADAELADVRSRESRKRTHLGQQSSTPNTIVEPKSKKGRTMSATHMQSGPSVSSLSTSIGSSFSVYEEDSESYSSWDVNGSEESDYDDENNPATIENLDFQKIALELNDEDPGKYPPPQQLTDLSTHGLGSPEKVWGLMLRIDEVFRPTSNLLLRHPSIEPRKRCILLDWMMEVCEELKQHRETFHLAVDYVDRFLAKSDNIDIDRYQLLGLTAIFIASKYEEIYPPNLSSFTQYTDGACKDDEVKAMEIVMLERLQWNLSPITAVHWLSFFMQMLGRKEASNNHLYPDRPCVIPDMMIDDFLHMSRIIDLSLMDVRTLRFSYRELAAAVMFCSLEPQKLIAQTTGFTACSLSAAVAWIEPFVRYCDDRRITGDPIPQHDGIRTDDLHNIQTKGLYDSIDSAMIEIETDRKDLAFQAREIRQAGKRVVLRARLRT